MFRCLLEKLNGPYLKIRILRAMLVNFHMVKYVDSMKIRFINSFSLLQYFTLSRIVLLIYFTTNYFDLFG